MTVKNLACFIMNDEQIDFSSMVIDGSKTLETRKKNVFKSHAMENLGMISKQGKEQYLTALVMFAPGFKVTDPAIFDGLTWFHRVPKGSKYYITETGKYLYNILNVIPIEPIKVTTKGVSNIRYLHDIQIEFLEA